MAGNAQPKIFKKIEVIEGGGHHGGGWKVAYADFMTAMMAFFLLMWILASSDEQQLKGIAEYFTNASLPGGSGVLDGATLGPPGTLNASNGSVVARGTELGRIDDRTPAKSEVRDVTEISEPDKKITADADGSLETTETSEAMQTAYATGVDAAQPGTSTASAAQDVEAEHPIDDMKFKELQEEIMQAMQENPALTPLMQNVIFEQTPEGLHIQIIDQEGKPMFQSGKAEATSATATLLSNLGKSLAQLPNKIVLSGHTDAVPFANSAAYDNWDLSTDRANATRRTFEASGVSRDRIIRVSGMADTDLLVPENPLDPSNRRISIMLQYQTETPREAPAEQEATETAHATEAPTPAEPASEAAHGDAGHGEKPSAEPQQEPVMEETRHAADHTQPAPNPLDDQVFQNLRNALR